MQGVCALQSTRGKTNCAGDNNSPYKNPYSSFSKMDSIGHDSQEVSTKGAKEACLP